MNEEQKAGLRAWLELEIIRLEAQLEIEPDPPQQHDPTDPPSAGFLLSKGNGYE